MQRRGVRNVSSYFQWAFAQLPRVCYTCVKLFVTCPQQIDTLIRSNLADIVVELLMTLYEGSGADGNGGDLKRFTG